MRAPLRIDNRTARRLWLNLNGLARPPIGAPPLADTLAALGFVQLDSIRVVSRAHHHILWSRNQTYRPKDMHRLAFDEGSDGRGAFEHFGHDASLFPMSHWPLWARRFRQFEEKLSSRWWMERLPDERGRAGILDRIARDGPLCSADFAHDGPRPTGMWERPPAKLALDWLWHTGALSTSHRQGFRKYYDLTERVIPNGIRKVELEDRAQIDGLCEAALARLGFASAGDISRFWNAVSLAEVKAWIARNELVPVEWIGADGRPFKGWALPGIEAQIAALRPATSRLRVLNPFDPALRDRKRLRALFGFDYVNEIFVPKPKRRWGYYVYPILEGERLTGRVDLSGSPKTGLPVIKNLWWEAGVKDSPRRRRAALQAELDRLGRFRS